MQRKGVPKGYREHWSYRGHWNEVKVAPKTWKIDFRATKNRKASMGSLKPGTKIVWKINAIQYATKTNKGKYQTRMIGTKKLVKINPRNK